MKVILPVAGKGERMRPYTNNLPKCLLPVGIFAIIAALLLLTLVACSNSEYVNDNVNFADESAFDVRTIDKLDSSDKDTQEESSNIKTYLPLDDTEYPYAGIPRIVIETENHRAIKDRETEIPAKLQIWGEKAPESEIMDLTIRGRGNTSWTEMPKKSYKIEFIDKQAMLGMPKDRDWALIANYADKTLIKNYLMYRLSRNLKAYYSPKCEFVELFLNSDYLGVYLLTETIKIGKNRINIPDAQSSYIVEFDTHFQDGEQIVYSNIISPTIPNEIGTPFRIHAPKNATNTDLEVVKQHISSFEVFLTTMEDKANNNVGIWIDIDEYIKHYWVQEFSKNPDACFSTSVFFSWNTTGLIKMGPIWDFDLSFGGHSNELPYKDYAHIKRITPEGWYIKYFYWNKYLFKDSMMSDKIKSFWGKNKNEFYNIIFAIDSTSSFLQNAADNNFKRWNVLQSKNYRFHTKAFATYKDAIKETKEWVQQRLLWIDSQYL